MRLTLDGVTLEALLVSDSDAVLELPALFAVKVTLMLTDWPGFSVMVPENDVVNWLAWLPLTVTPVMLATAEPAPPVCVMVMGSVFDVPLGMLPKSSELGEMLSVGGGVNVPVRLMLDGDTLAALLATAKVAVFDPAEVGAKVTFTVVDWP